MTGASHGLDRRTLADLTARIARARPEAISAIVALIDRLPDRGEADALIAPMRPRLNRMRDIVRRPASLGRVLAHPIEDLLVEPDVWRRGSLSVPRSVMTTAIGLVTDALPATTRQEIRRRLAGATMEDTAAVAEAGAVLWPAASSCLSATATGALPTGLSLPMREADFRSSLAALGETLRIAAPLAALLGESPRGATHAWAAIEPRARDLLAEAERLSADCFARAGLILMRRFMASGPVVGLLREAAGRSKRGEAERRLAASLDSYLAELPAQLPEAATLALLPHQVQQEAVTEAVAAIERAGNEIGTWQVDRRDNLLDVQGQMAAVLRRRIPECLSAELAAPIARIHAEGLGAGGGPAGLEGLEAAARAASAMTAAARRLGPADDLQLAIRRAADTIAALAASTPQGAPADRIGRIDLARLVEILTGPDTAERILAAHA
ncbi:hypothetical protein [Elioraea sp.]|uniref:hypothetical protein n=1 Tax=Elioraea sp. TaxID=2185103 RepID=UPI0025C1B2BC|nr:hypothetical protein [Elioraea sp.]